MSLGVRVKVREIPTAEIHRSVLNNRVEFRDLRNPFLNKSLRPNYYSPITARSDFVKE